MKALGHLTDQQIAKLEAAGGKRWQKYGNDRIYIDATKLGLEVEYYKSGSVSSASWQGEGISNADGRRLLYSKVYVDVMTGELSVTTSFDAKYMDADEVEEAAEQFVADALAPEPEPEPTDADDDANTSESEKRIYVKAFLATEYTSGITEYTTRFGGDYGPASEADSPIPVMAYADGGEYETGEYTTPRAKAQDCADAYESVTNSVKPGNALWQFFGIKGTRCRATVVEM